MKAVIFDFNGTLFNDHDKHVKAWDAIAKRIRGRGMDEEELQMNCNGLPNQKIIRYINGGPMDPQIENDLSRKKEALYRRFCLEDPDSFHLTPGAQELFEDLRKARIPFTIASASIRENIDFFVENFHLDNWMDPSLIIYDDGTYPDKVNMFLDAAKILKTPIDQITVIEDSLSGVTCANKAGVQDIRLIDTANKTAILSQLPHVTQVCKTMHEIHR